MYCLMLLDVSEVLKCAIRYQSYKLRLVWSPVPAAFCVGLSIAQHDLHLVLWTASRAHDSLSCAVIDNYALDVVG